MANRTQLQFCMQWYAYRYMGENGRLSQTFYIFAAELFKWSLCRTKKSSSPTLPTINDICSKMANMSAYDSCTVHALQFEDVVAASKGLAEAQQ